MLLLLLACTGPEKTPSTQVPTTCDAESLLQSLKVERYTTAPTVRVDRYGIPHIEAENARDAFYASGYMQARDRLFQLEMNRRRVTGERSEILGDAYLEEDMQARLFGFGRYACQSLEATYNQDPEHLALAVAFVAGINQRIAEVNEDPSLLPPEFVTYNFSPTPYTPEDVISIGSGILFGFSNTLEFDLLYTLIARTVPSYEEIPVFQPGVDRFIMGQAAPGGPARPRPQLAPLDPEAIAASTFLEDVRNLGKGFHNGPGSNNWAVSGRVTENGRPMIANDTHSSLGDPNTMYMQHVRAGSYDVVGFTFVGTPAVQLGHNAKVAWTATTNWADVVDLWDVEIDGDQVMLGGKAYDLLTEEHIIKVRQADGSITDHPFTAQWVPDHGVILTDEALGLPTGLVANGALMFNWAGFGPNDDLSMFLDFNEAEDLDDFVNAVDLQDAGMMNWLGATADGIRYRTHARLPVRGKTVIPNMVMDGNDPDAMWQGWLGAEDLPTLDGSEDFITTANNDPWGHTADNDPTNDEFYYGSFFDPGFRAERISNVLQRNIQSGPITLEQMQTLQLDTYSLLAERFLPLLSESVAHIGSNPELVDYENRPELAEAVARLEAWDRQMRRDSSEAVLYRVWSGYLTRATLGDELGIVYATVEAGKPQFLEKVALLSHEGAQEKVLDRDGDLLRVKALSDALVWIAARESELGVSPLTWGDVHVASFVAPDGSTTTYPADGGNDSVDAAENPFWGEGEALTSFRSTEGPILRDVTQFGDDGVPQMRFSAPFSNEGDGERWLEGDYVDLPFTEEQIVEATVGTVEIP
ncbi:MAG TPA: penicillin acylase family protein [Myxococcota bacterium]|nr:penicillin acylase family protein [Myxococcota bacterium]